MLRTEADGESRLCHSSRAKPLLPAWGHSLTLAQGTGPFLPLPSHGLPCTANPKISVRIRCRGSPESRGLSAGAWTRSHPGLVEGTQVSPRVCTADCQKVPEHPLQRPGGKAMCRPCKPNTCPALGRGHRSPCRHSASSRKLSPGKEDVTKPRSVGRCGLGEICNDEAVFPP